MKLSLETRNRGDVMIVHCHGRIVYRDEAAALSRLAGEILENTSKVVFDLSGVSSIDSAGIGMLMACSGLMEQKHGKLRISGAQGGVARTFEVVHIGRVAALDGDLDTACRELAQD